MAKKKPQSPERQAAAVIRRLRKKYVTTKKIGDKWNTYLQIDHQGFCVVRREERERRLPKPHHCAYQ